MGKMRTGMKKEKEVGGPPTTHNPKFWKGQRRKGGLPGGREFKQRTWGGG